MSRYNIFKMAKDLSVALREADVATVEIMKHAAENIEAMDKCAATEKKINELSIHEGSKTAAQESVGSPGVRFVGGIGELTTRKMSGASQDAESDYVRFLQTKTGGH